MKFRIYSSPTGNTFSIFRYNRIFPENLLIAKISLIYKKDEFLLTNYRTVSIFPCFLKLFELMTCNRLFKYLSENNILYEKKFGLQTFHSQLVC